MKMYWREGHSASLHTPDMLSRALYEYDGSIEPEEHGQVLQAQQQLPSTACPMALLPSTPVVALAASEQQLAPSRLYRLTKPTMAMAVRSYR